MQVIGTVLILLAFVISFFYFSYEKKKKDVLDREAHEMFWSCLENLQIKEEQLNIVMAGGDDNSEVSVVDAIKNVSLSGDARIKRYEQN